MKLAKKFILTFTTMASIAFNSFSFEPTMLTIEKKCDNNVCSTSQGATLLVLLPLIAAGYVIGTSGIFVIDQIEISIISSDYNHQKELVAQANLVLNESQEYLLGNRSIVIEALIKKVQLLKAEQNEQISEDDAFNLITETSSKILDLLSMKK